MILEVNLSDGRGWSEKMQFLFAYRAGTLRAGTWRCLTPYFINLMSHTESGSFEVVRTHQWVFNCYSLLTDPAFLLFDVPSFEGDKGHNSGDILISRPRNPCGKPLSDTSRWKRLS